MVNKKLVVLAVGLLVIVIIVAASIAQLHPSNSNQDLKVIRQDTLGGPFNAILNVTASSQNGSLADGDLVYTKDGIEHIGYYSTYMNGSMTWINNNTPKNAIFFNWWDYGDAIVALGERESISKNPSQEALTSVVGAVGELDPHSKITDVATALTATDENITKTVMQKVGANYLFITFDDVTSKAYWIFHFAGLNSTDYVSAYMGARPNSAYLDYTTLGQQTMLYKLYNNFDLSMFTQVYSDENVRIFKLNN